MSYFEVGDKVQYIGQGLDRLRGIVFEVVDAKGDNYRVSSKSVMTWLPSDELSFHSHRESAVKKIAAVAEANLQRALEAEKQLVNLPEWKREYQAMEAKLAELTKPKQQWAAISYSPAHPESVIYGSFTNRRTTFVQYQYVQAGWMRKETYPDGTVKVTLEPI